MPLPGGAGDGSAGKAGRAVAGKTNGDEDEQGAEDVGDAVHGIGMEMHPVQAGVMNPKRMLGG